MARKKATLDHEANGTGSALLPEPVEVSEPASAIDPPPSDTNGTLPETPALPVPNGNGEQRKPVRVLSYLVAKDTFVQASIWERLVTLGDGTTFLTHDVSVRKRYRDALSGEWKSLYSLRGSEIYAVLHALSQASAWILEARADAHSCPF